MLFQTNDFQMTGEELGPSYIQNSNSAQRLRSQYLR